MREWYERQSLALDAVTWVSQLFTFFLLWEWKNSIVKAVGSRGDEVGRVFVYSVSYLAFFFVSGGSVYSCTAACFGGWVLGQ